MMRTLFSAMLMLCSGAVFAGADAFTLRIQAPDEVRQLLAKHLELLRYAELVDLSDGELQRLILDVPANARDLIAYLGYFSPVIEVQMVAGSSDPDSARQVLITVQPGRQTKVGAVNIVFEGEIASNPNAQVQRQTMEGGWTLPVGSPFTQTQWDAAKQQLIQALLAQRFAAGRLVLTRADIDADNALASLEIHLDSGPTYHLGSVTVEGAQRYGTDLVQRFIGVIPGEAYTRAKLTDAQQRLTDSGYYDAAYLTLNLESPPDQVEVLAEVREAPVQKLVFGVGASTDSGVRMGVEHTYNEVPGPGWRAVNKASADRNTRTFTSDWTSKPDRGLWRWAGSATFETQKIGEIDIFNQRYRAGRFLAEKHFDQSYFMQFERVDTQFNEWDEAAFSEALSANYAFTLRKLDNLPFPAQGWAFGGELAAGSTLGTAQAPFARALLRGRVYQPLDMSSTSADTRQRAGRLAIRAEAGAVVVNDPASLPFTELFLAGGDNSVRGYQRQEIGVFRNGQLTTESGRYLATGSVEWLRPVYRGGVMTDWESAVFVDAGAVADEPGALDLKFGVGVGARWKSPIGPLQIDLAYGAATQKIRLHLTVGFVF